MCWMQHELLLFMRTIWQMCGTTLEVLQCELWTLTLLCIMTQAWGPNVLALNVDAIMYYDAGLRSPCSRSERWHYYVLWRRPEVHLFSLWTLTLLCIMTQAWGLPVLALNVDTIMYYDAGLRSPVLTLNFEGKICEDSPPATLNMNNDFMLWTTFIFQRSNLRVHSTNFIRIVIMHSVIIIYYYYYYYLESAVQGQERVRSLYQSKDTNPPPPRAESLLLRR